MNPMLPQRSRDDFVIRKGQYSIADDLASLMALAGDDEHVARAQLCDAGAIAAARSRDFGDLRPAPGVLRARQDCGADRGGLLAARIVVGDDDEIGAARGDFAHQRPLALVAVAAAAEDDDQPALGQRTQRREDLFQRVGLVGVIDEDRRAVAGADEFEPPRRALQIVERREDVARAASPAAMASPAATSALEVWKAPASGSSTL